MKVARTLTVLLALVALVVMTVLTLVLVYAELSYLADDMEADHLAIGRALGPAVAVVWTDHGEAAAHAMLDRAQHRAMELSLQDGVARALLPPDMARKLAAQGLASFEAGDFRRTWVKLPLDREAYLEVKESVSGHYVWVRGLLKTVLASAFALLLTFVLVATVSGRILIGRPVEHLVAFAQRIGSGDFSARADVAAANELGELGRQLDSMAVALLSAREQLKQEQADKLEAEERMHHAERLGTVGKLAAGIAHEMGTPLSVVATWGRMIASGEATGDDVHKGGQIVADEAGAMTRIIRQLLDFARRKTPQRGEVDAQVLLATTVRLLGTLASQRQVALEQRPLEPCPVLADAVQLQQVLTNLVMNSVQASKPGQKVEVWACREQHLPPVDVDRADGRRPWVVLHVLDHGSGIAPEVLPHVFEPFFTTKEVGEGSGLGLSVSWSLVRDHGGWISVSSEMNAGSHFAVYLPA
jgi:two-component system, NtrC family, sensor kinase